MEGEAGCRVVETSTRAVHTSAEFSVLVSDTANILVTSSYCVLACDPWTLIVTNPAGSSKIL